MFGFGQLFCRPQVRKIADLENQNAVLQSRVDNITETNKKLIFMVKALTQGIFTIDMEKRIDFWSHGLETMLSIPYELAVGKTYSHFFPGLAEAQIDPFTQILEGNNKVTVELTFEVKATNQSQASNTIPIALVFVAMKNDLGNLIGIVAEVKDLNEQKRYEEMQLDFVSIVTHELRTPATSIKGYLSLLLDEGQNLTEEQKQFLRRAYISNERQIHTIESIVTVSRIENEVLKPEPEATQLEPLVAEVAKFIRDDAKNKGLEVRLNYPQFALPKVSVDPTFIRQVVYALLSNAVKFTEAGFIEVSFSQENNAVTMIVKDTGSGIDAEMQHKIFERFSRGERPFTESTQGLGLGLYTTKAMVESMHGTIRVESEVGRGSTFYVTLPVA